MSYTPRAFAILDRLLPPADHSVEALVDEVLMRTGARSMRQVARALGATVKVKGNLGAHALCIPVGEVEHGRRGARYAILVDAVRLDQSFVDDNATWYTRWETVVSEALA